MADLHSADDKIPPRAVLEQWVDGSTIECVLDPGSVDLRKVIASLGPGLSSLLTISVGDRSLIISVSHDKYTVTALLGEDDFFDRVGDGTASGTEEFVQGGQSVEVPRRHLVAREIAARAAIEFLDLGTVPMIDEWDRQGVNDIMP